MISGRQFHAATKYLSYYWLNARVRVDYCDAQGVRISDFKRTFERSESRNYAHALKIQSGGDSNVAERLYASALPSLTSAIQGDMQSIIKQAGGGPREACALVDSKAAFIVSHLDFEKHKPSLYADLMER